MKTRLLVAIFTLSIISVLSADEGSSFYEDIYNSVLTNDLDELSLLLEQCENINRVVSDGKHVFEIVFIMGNCEAAEMLLDAGVDLNYVSNDGISLKEKVLESHNQTLINFIPMYLD